MARPRKFDRDEVLGLATEAFWRHGYAGTSLARLDQVTGLQRGSLYNGFGDKHQLFLACLDHYAEREIGAAVALLALPGQARRKVRKLFLTVVEASKAAGGRRGCLLCNSAVELAPHDKAVEAKVSHHLDSLRAAFHQALTADRNGRTNREIAAAADQLTASYMGLLVMTKAGLAASRLRHIAQGAAALCARSNVAAEP